MTSLTRPQRIEPIGVAAFTATCGAGAGLDALAAALMASRSSLQPLDDAAWPLATWVGRVAGLESASLPPEWAVWDCRATRLAWLALQADGFIHTVQAARARHGATRLGLVLGTSASTIGASEEAYRQLDADGLFPPTHRHARLNTPHGVAAFVQAALGIEGPSVTVSTACSSSAKVFASAECWLRLGWVDAVVVAGVEALSASLLYGFRSLGLVSPEPCRPFDAQRQGISVGEAAGFALLTREPAALRLRGHGESNDAHHMSSPHPRGLGAEQALDDALARAGLDAGAIDFVNLHGTASAMNDEVEAALMARRYAADVHACATKGLTGHTMGAAGIVEAAICLLALQGRGRAGSATTQAVDPAFGPVFAAQLQRKAQGGAARRAASHSFGFGGNNCVLIFDRADHEART